MPPAFTYNYMLDAPPTALDQVRSLIGDTDSTAVLLYDSEVQDYLTGNNGSVYQAAINCCTAIAAKYSRRADVKADDISKMNSQIAKAYRNLSSELQVQLALQGTSPKAGGISKGDKNSVILNPDRVEPSFTRTTGAPPESNIGIVNDQQVNVDVFG